MQKKCSEFRPFSEMHRGVKFMGDRTTSWTVLCFQSNILVIHGKPLVIEWPMKVFQLKLNLRTVSVYDWLKKNTRATFSSNQK